MVSSTGVKMPGWPVVNVLASPDVITGLWGAATVKVIGSGADDAELTAWARRFASFPHPILMRMRWEMDRPNLRSTMGSGADFVAAWKHVRAIFAAQHVTNVSWVWCPTSVGFATGEAQAFYPGDSEVDWTCVDVYAGAVYVG